MYERDSDTEPADQREEIVEHRPAVARLTEGGGREHDRKRLPAADDVGQRLLMQRAGRIARADRIDTHGVGDRRRRHTRRRCARHGGLRMVLYLERVGNPLAGDVDRGLPGAGLGEHGLDGVDPPLLR